METGARIGREDADRTDAKWLLLQWRPTRWVGKPLRAVLLAFWRGFCCLGSCSPVLLSNRSPSSRRIDRSVIGCTTLPTRIFSQWFVCLMNSILASLTGAMSQSRFCRHFRPAPMDDVEYERICELSAYPSGHDGDEQPLSVSEEVFLVIKRQAEHRRLRAALRTHRQDKTLKRYIARHGQHPASCGSSAASHGDNKEVAKTETFCAIAKSVDFSPCMLARVLLEAKYGWAKTTISSLFKDIMNGTRRWPIRLPSHEFIDGTSGERKQMTEAEYDRVWREVEECIHHDVYCSPLADRIRHNMGLEYEYTLVMKLQSRGLLFESEDALRERGLSKTPDVRLVIPIAVRDSHGDMHVVNWIDSKAMFGDRHTHDTENAAQLQGYVNRYGPGMVIYWFGHVAQLSSDRDVYITDAFPRDIVLPGGVDPFMGLPAAPAEGSALSTRTCSVHTAFDEQFHPTSTSSG